ncbi:hypothetical protein CDL15_Pgr013958 [Punica granatum]|uniref:Uncharacterized protein n=1 Tax=Punica granatum TaxID=22663 RepID=A0A218W9G5_PUNGR|nr:hypothetical protein CDL15_Pgr013958 [Punica granatum]
MSPDQISGNAEAVLWTMATLAASFMLIRSIVNDFLPNEVRVYRLDCAEHIPMVFNSVGTPKNVVTLNHPMTFRTLTIDPELKTTILEDLDIFINGEKYYQSIGKAWKLGYLLCGLRKLANLA